MRGVGETKLPVYIVLGTVLLNFALDPLFIFGWKFIPAMGVMGAAVATLGTQSIAAFIGLFVLLHGKYGIHLSLSDFKPDFTFIKRAFFLGLPVSIEQSARSLGFTVMTFLVASFGTLTVAAYGAGSTIVQVIIIPMMGVSMAISTLVGQNIGAKNIKRASEIGRIGAWISFWAMTTVGVIVFFTARYIITFFVPNDPDVISSGTVFLRIIALSWGFMAVQFSLNGVLRASGNMMTTMILALVSQWVIQFPMAYILSKHTSLGVMGFWWSFSIPNVIMCFITLAWYMRGDWKKTKITEEDALQEKVTEEVFIEEGVRQ